MDLVLTLFFERTAKTYAPVPQSSSKRGIEDNSKIIFLISEKKKMYVVTPH